MSLSPEERAALEQRVSEEQDEIERKRHRLATGVGPIQQAEIEKDIGEREGLIRGWIAQIRASET